MSQFLKPQSPMSLSRRNLMLVGGGVGATLALQGCSLFSLEPDVAEETVAPGVEGGLEAPELAARVEAGELPPLEERLPKNPLVVEPLDTVGVYGGIWRSSMITQEDSQWLGNAIGYEPLVRRRPDWSRGVGAESVVEGVCAEFSDSDGGRVFEFTMRDGLRWSDGEPCTPEDVRFTYEDVNLNLDINPGGADTLWLNSSDGSPAEFEVDGLTFRWIYKDPKPGFFEQISANARVLLPKHYMEQFHGELNSNVDDLVKEANLNDWLQLWEARVEPWSNADLPTLNGWIVTNELGKGTAVTAARNPYYYKVDTEGKQLPYIDSINCEVLLDVEVQVLKIASGEIDLQMRNFSTIRNKPVITRNAEDGDYRVFTVGPQGINSMVMGFNQTLSDPVKRSLYSNKDFRIGLSHAINRQRIIDSVYAGQGKPWQCAPMEDSPVYNEKFGTQYLEYSEDLANEALDRAGYTERDGAGFRLYERGRIIVSTVVPASLPDHVDALELIKADWNAVGVELQIQRVAETLYWERVEANQAETSTWQGSDFDVVSSQGSNHFYVPSNPRGSSRWGNQWALWYRSEAAEGEEPPANVKESLELFDEMRNTYDPDTAVGLGKEIMEIAQENFFYIGICTPPDAYGIASNKLANVPDYMSGLVSFYAPGPSNPESYYFTS